MVKLKYPKNIWTKVLILVVLILIFLVHIDIKLREEENLNMEKFYIQYCIDYPFAVLNIQYQDSIFRVVVKDEVYSLKEKYQDKLQNALTKNDVLSIDSIMYSELKSKRVMKSPKIDSLFNGNVDNLLSSCFNKFETLSISLSDQELYYLIDILYQNNIILGIDCETGVVSIMKK